MAGHRVSCQSWSGRTNSRECCSVSIQRGAEQNSNWRLFRRKVSFDFSILCLALYKWPINDHRWWFSFNFKFICAFRLCLADLCCDLLGANDDGKEDSSECLWLKCLLYCSVVILRGSLTSEFCYWVVLCGTEKIPGDRSGIGSYHEFLAWQCDCAAAVLLLISF